MKKIKNPNKYLILSIFVLSFIFISKIAFGIPGDPTVNVTATPSSVISGNISYINWSSTNADSCVLSGGNITGSGTFTSSPGIATNPILSNTTYTVVCTNDSTGATASDSVIVTVGTTPVITVLTATPASVVSGGTSSIHWESNIATSCSLSPGNGTGLTGTFTTPALTTNTTYTITCLNSGSGTTASQSVTVTIASSAPPTNPITVTVNASPNPIYYGATTTINWTSTGASYCQTLPGGLGGGVGKTSNFITPKLTSNTTYSVSCNLGGFCKAKAVFASQYSCKKDDDGNDITDAKTCLEVIADAGTGNTGGSQVCEWDSSNIIATNQNSVLVTVLPPAGSYGTSITDIYTKKALTDVSDKKTMIKFLGEMNPGGDENVVAYFRYSTISPKKVTPVFCNDIYGSNMRATNEIPVRGNTKKSVSIEEGDLNPDTTYYYCVVGSTTNQIAYGGVMSFTTSNSSEGDISITTKGATVVDGKSAYLNGFYNTTVPSKTYFEYRKKSSGAIKQNIVSIIFDAISDNFLKINKVLAVVNTNTENNAYSWKKVNEQAQNKNTSGNLSFLLTGLSSSTVYEFRAVIKNNSSSDVKYGVISEFKTKGSNSTGEGTGGGEGYQDPCANTDTDVNCSGTGGGGGGGGGLTGLPDLTSGISSPSFAIVNSLVTLSAFVRNQGDASTFPPNTLKNVVPSTINNSAPAPIPTSFLNNFFQTNKALAVADVAPTNTTTRGNTTTGGSASTKGNFYSFFQISTKNPIYVTPGTINNPAPAPEAVSFLKNFFETKEVMAAVNTNTTTGGNAINNTFINLPPILISSLGPKGSREITQDYTFASIGNYYVRVCADKKSPADLGLIRESYEDNNCGPWSKITVDFTNLGMGNITGDGTGDNTGGGTGTGTGTGGGGGGSGTVNYENLVLGQIATPPDLAIVRYHEGIETVLARQITANTELAESYGYQQGADLQSFAWYLSHLLAKTFGYVGNSGKEIRVSKPDIAAYQLYMKDGILTIYEYYDSKIVNIQKMTDALRNKYEYEYYFKK